MARERHDAAFVVGAILGGAAGAVYALLNAPQSGPRTRAQLGEAADALVQRVADAAVALRSFLQERGGRDGASAVAAAPAGDGPAPAAEAPVYEPVHTLPDPLEPDPVIGGPAPPDVVPVALTAADPASDADVVLDGPRPGTAGHDPGETASSSG